MKSVVNVFFTKQQNQALEEIREKLKKQFKIESLIIFGSIVRGEADEESDIDLLILTSQSLIRLDRHVITDLIFEINLQYGTNFSTLVIDRDSWENGPISILPFRDHVIKEGIQLWGMMNSGK